MVDRTSSKSSSEVNDQIHVNVVKPNSLAMWKTVFHVLHRMTAANDL